jgi:hypothetical protein
MQVELELQMVVLDAQWVIAKQVEVVEQAQLVLAKMEAQESTLTSSQLAPMLCMEVVARDGLELEISVALHLVVELLALPLVMQQ